MAVVTVHGRAEQQVAPDTVLLHGSLRSQDRTAERALATLREGQQRLVEAVEATVSFEQVRSWQARDERRRDTHHAITSFTIALRDTARAGPVAEQVVAAGAELGWAQWCVDDDAPAHAAVRQQAVARARTKAAQYAEAVGCVLGPLVQLADRTTAEVFPAARPRGGAMMAMESADAPPLQLEPEWTTIAAEAEVVYELVPATTPDTAA